MVADSREVYQQGEVYSGTNRRNRTHTEKGKVYQLKILFGKKTENTYKDDKRMQADR